MAEAPLAERRSSTQLHPCLGHTPVSEGQDNYRTRMVYNMLLEKRTPQLKGGYVYKIFPADRTSPKSWWFERGWVNAGGSHTLTLAWKVVCLPSTVVSRT